MTDTSVYFEGLSDWEQIVGTGIERIVLDFVHGAYGEHMDVEAMTALMADDFVWQLNVPLSPVIRGRDAARAELEKHNQLASGMVDGSEIRTVVSNEDSKICWREYWDTGDVARQLDSDPEQMFEQIGS